MSSLPAEVDFTANPAATSARMDQAMEFLVAWLRRVESVQPEFLAVTAQLKTIGLERLDAVLSPIFVDAQGIAGQLEAIRANWLSGEPLTGLMDDLADQVTAGLAGVDASIAARLGDNATQVAGQLTANATAVQAQLTANAAAVKVQTDAAAAAVTAANTAVANANAAVAAMPSRAERAIILGSI